MIRPPEPTSSTETNPVILPISASVLVMLLMFTFGPEVGENGPGNGKVGANFPNSIAELTADSLDWTDSIESRIVASSAVTELGKKLFHEPRLSRTGQVSCASCHDLGRGGDDGLQVSLGVDGRPGSINAPTVLNSGLNPIQFWDGRAESLEEQVNGPLQHHSEMDSTWDQAIRFLSQDAKYRQEFQAVFHALPTPTHVRKAISDFERTLTTANSPFDRWSAGDQAALSAKELAGYQAFKDCGCISCHQGANFGGNSFQELGVMRRFFTASRRTTEADMGRFNVTGLEADKHCFRVPPLRNVALTAPYFHDGSAKTLRDAVEAMLYYQVGRELVAKQVDELVSFLESLTGSLEGDVL